MPVFNELMGSDGPMEDPEERKTGKIKKTKNNSPKNTTKSNNKSVSMKTFNNTMNIITLFFILFFGVILYFFVSYGISTFTH